MNGGEIRMKLGERSLGESLEARDYGWVESYLGSRSPAASDQGYPESVSVIVESDLFRTVLFTILLGGLASLMVYVSIGVAAGKGRSIFQLTATLAAFLACGAAASRRRRWLRLVLALGSLCVFALLVDQLVYYRWHNRVDRFITTLKQGVESGSPAYPDPMKLRPTSLWIDPDREVLLTFEPPLLAWTYRLDSASSIGHTLLAGWYRILSRVARGRNLDRVARALVRPHESYSVGVRSAERTLACREAGKGDWTLSIDSPPGSRPL
jgi:hypothetical protein